MKRVRLIVSAAEADISLESLLTGRGRLPPALFLQVLKAGGVFVDRRRASSPDAVLRTGAEVVATLREKGREGARPSTLPLSRLLHLDAEIAAIDKPAGLPSQGTAADAKAGADEALRRLLSSRGEEPALWIVHRLDLETSGVMVFGRTPRATTHLAQAFREQAVSKTYRLLVTGLPREEEWWEEATLGAARDRGGRVSVGAGGKPARTHFRVLERWPEWETSLLEARPQTGRTHQIRAHAAHAGHPLLGDGRYGGRLYVAASDGRRLELPRLALHALTLDLEHPSGGRWRAEATWPSELNALCEALSSATPPLF